MRRREFIGVMGAAARVAAGARAQQTDAGDWIPRQQVSQ